MPPRFAYWTIILDGTPTSFRTKEREEILPLFNQLKAKNPTALLKWFSGGTLWDSPEQAREERERVKVRAFREERAKEAKAQQDGAPDPLAEFRIAHGRPADGSDDPSRSAAQPPMPAQDRAPRRGKDWRPGGEHRDPADKYKLPPGEARKRWKERHLGPRGPKPFGSKPGGDRPWSDKPRGPKPFGSKPPGDRPWSDKPRGSRPFGSRPPGDRPWSDKRGGPPSTLRQAQGRPEQGRGATRGGDDRSLRPGKPFGSKPGGDRRWSSGSSDPGAPRAPRPFGAKPFGSKPGGPRKPFGARPPAGRPPKGRPPRGPRGKK